MDYEKKYKEALEWAQKVKQGKVGFVLDEVLEIFPELKESEDEKMVNFIANELACIRATDEKGTCRYEELTKAIAWLEKQGEQKSADKVEHKFKVGDEIKIANEEPLIITKIDKEGYWSEDLFICGFDEECIWDLVEQNNPAWSEEDEAAYYGVIETEKYMLDVVNGIRKFDVGNISIKEECAKELNWLKSLKDRVQPKYEWSDEDEDLYNRIVRSYTSYENRIIQAKDLSDDNRNNILTDLGEQEIWLRNRIKSLRPQNTWKPSDKQMKQLGWIAEQNKDNIIGKELMLLYQDLKKLREE